MLTSEPDWTCAAMQHAAAIRTTAAALSREGSQGRPIRRRRATGVCDATRRIGDAAPRRAPRCQGAPGSAALRGPPQARSQPDWRGARALGAVAPEVPPRVTRIDDHDIRPGGSDDHGVDRDLALTPDGTRIVYVGNGGTRLFVRTLDALEPVSLASGTDLRGPFVSPDGQWVGFYERQALRKVCDQRAVRRSR